MPDFSVIVQTPQMRAIVQENLLQRQFHDALFPKTLFRGEAVEQEWAGNVGDTMYFSAPGLMVPDQTPIQPGQDVNVGGYDVEQWLAQLQQYGKAIDTSMPSSFVAIANLFLRNTQQIGLQAAQTVNRIVRNRLYGGALSGQTVTSAGADSTSVPVVFLNGFTRARNPNTGSFPNGSPVRFDLVSSSNPLPINIYHSGTAYPANVIGFTANNPGDEIGPGVLTIDAAITFSAGDAVQSFDCTSIIRSGGGNSVADISNTDLIKFADVRSAISQLEDDNVSQMPDGRFHAHIDPITKAQLFSDPEFTTIFTALPDHPFYKGFVLGEIMGCVFIQNTECPQVKTVGNKTGTGFSLSDPFPGQLTSNGLAFGSAGAVPIHRPLFIGQGGIFEKYVDGKKMLFSEAGLNGKQGDFAITNNNIQVVTDRINLILRAPLDRLGQMVSVAWSLIADWPLRTDAATGGNSRYKREVAVEHGSATT